LYLPWAPPILSAAMNRSIAFWQSQSTQVKIFLGEHASRLPTLYMFVYASVITMYISKKAASGPVVAGALLWSTTKGR